MDLLVKWLGPESSSYASSIKAANVAYPERGLQRIWERLEDRYGRPEMVESALKTKIKNFPKLNRDYARLYQLSDILSEIESCKENPKYSTLLSYFDSSSGVRPIVNKLPFGLQEKWTSHASKYKSRHNVPFPPFSHFVEWVKEISSIKKRSSLCICTPSIGENDRNVGPRHSNNSVYARKTDVTPTMKKKNTVKRCPIHKAGHSLDDCRAFKCKSFEERRDILMKHNICFRCCAATDHVSHNCNAKVKCDHCSSSRHTSAMHIDRDSTAPKVADGGERPSPADPVSTNCTTLCGKGFSGRSCGKITLVEVFPMNQPELATKGYAILDDQSNRSLASTELFDQLGVSGDPSQYTLSSCSGSMTMTGRRAVDIMVRSLSDSCSIKLPTLIECDSIPNNLSEIPTPEVAESYSHLECIASEVPSFDPYVKIGILIERDLPSVHHVLGQIIGPERTPFAQELRLGWVIVGDVCLDGKHQPDTVCANKTNILTDGRRTIFEPCENSLTLQEKNCNDLDQMMKQESQESVFCKTPNDEKVGLSVEDRKFLRLMEKEFHKDEQGHWTAPLPFRSPRLPMPNNRPIAWKREKLLDLSLKKDPVKREHFRTFMRKVLDSGAAEVAPAVDPDKECWYLPLFRVYHPKKPGQIRGVFYSSVIYQGISLNSMLMTGPDMTNSLLGVLLRFRKDAFAATADIEQMFYRFYVNVEHRDYLRFFWYKNNDPDDSLIEFRMKVNVFGNSPSPAVATYGLQRAVSTQGSSAVRDFVMRNFYVDDGLLACPSVSETVDILSETRGVLKSEGNIRLHKIVSNSPQVMKAFPSDDLGKDLKTVQIGQDSLPVQRSLGISWDLNSDSFIFDSHLTEKPFTKRGMLSTVNGLFDPMGFLAPITLKGKVLLREAAPSGTDWDKPLSPGHLAEWKFWCDSLQSLRDIHIPRMFVPLSLSTCKEVEVFIFSDASETAIAAVAYAKVTHNAENSHVGFILGKSKLAPQKGHTIPRLELCSAVLAVELGEIIWDQLGILSGDIKYFIDSKVVLGYIRNETRRFYTYVSNRVDQIRRLSVPSQWNYVPTDLNPADLGTRTNTSAEDIKNSAWLRGPKWLIRDTVQVDSGVENFPLVSPENDKEIRPDVIVQKTLVGDSTLLGSQRFQRFSRWKSLVKAVSFLIHIVRSFKNRTGPCSGWHWCNVYDTKLYQDSEIHIIKEVQKECFTEEITCLLEDRQIPKSSNIIALRPFLDSTGVLRVGGRLNKLKGSLPTGELNPIIMPKNNHVSTLLVHNFHEGVKHQGRHLTEGAIREGGFWIVGAKNLISSVIQKCVTCRKLRRDFESQLMADLPTDRLTPGPPFTSVGPWEVVTRKTRGGAAASKRWAILFTCLVTRAVHIEVIQEMSSSCFINALCRFISLRGSVKLFRSDKGTNFTGATNELRLNTINVEDGPVANFL